MKVCGLAIWTALLVIVFNGCVSSERQAEYRAWRNSDDGVAVVSLEEFESKYQQGWRERAEQKKRERLARQKAEEELASRRAEYERWLASDDKEEGVDLETFESKYKSGWEARAEQKKQERLAREEKEREEAELKRKEEAVLNEIREDLRKESKALVKVVIESKYKNHPCQSPFRQESGDWLCKLVEPRLDVSESEKLEGESILSDFGGNFMPNAYAALENQKDSILEVQQILNENFPEYWKLRSENPKNQAFNKVLGRFSRKMVAFWYLHDQICQYWSYYSLGLITPNELAEVDGKILALNEKAKILTLKLKLLPAYKSLDANRVKILEIKELDADTMGFVNKYMPETYQLYQKVKQDYLETRETVNKISDQSRKLDFVRFDFALYCASHRCNALARFINFLNYICLKVHASYQAELLDSERIAFFDHGCAKNMMKCNEQIANYLHGRIIRDQEMISLPNGLKMQRTEVTQMQWMRVMGYNPSVNVGVDRPVENVTLAECQTFIEKVSAHDGVAYRMPTLDELAYAYKAMNLCRTSYATDCLVGGCGCRIWNKGGSLNNARCNEIVIEDIKDLDRVLDLDKNGLEFGSDSAGSESRVKDSCISFRVVTQ